MSGLGQALRRSLWPVSWIYGAGAWVRNWMFDAGLRKARRLPVPVISVGNLTVGGTGKTPLVVWLVEQARQRGLRPGVLARGYGRKPGQALNDEGMLLQERFPDLPQVQDPDRHAAGERMLQQNSVDRIILDDGFQHRQLHRDCNVLCLDANNPFTFGLLPAGDLREPRSGLRRASVVVITRADGLAKAEIERRTRRVQQIAGREVAVLAAVHAARDIVSLPDGQVLATEWLRGRRLLLLSGLARPESFAQTVTGLGGEVVDEIRRPDHHDHSRDELLVAVAAATQQNAHLLVTEKDEVKLRTIGDEVVRFVLRIDLRFVHGDPTPELFGL